MSKYKVGDRVKIIKKYTEWSTYKKYEGRVATIIAIDEESYSLDIDNGVYNWFDNEFELYVGQPCVEQTKEYTMTVETTRKIWNFSTYFSCKYCGSEMYLIDSDDILGTSSYDCSNEKCNSHYWIWSHGDEEGEWEEGDKINTTTTINFYNLYKQNKVSKNDIHAYIDIWHNRKINNDITLHEFLGLSWKQYSLWVNEDKLD